MGNRNDKNGKIGRVAIYTLNFRTAFVLRVPSMPTLSRPYFGMNRSQPSKSDTVSQSLRIFSSEILLPTQFFSMLAH